MSGDLELSDLPATALEGNRSRSCAVVLLAYGTGIGDGAWFRQLLELQAARGPGPAWSTCPGSRPWTGGGAHVAVGRPGGQPPGGALVVACPQPEVALLLKTAGAAQVVAVYESVQRASGGLTVNPAANGARGQARRPADDRDHYPSER